GLGDRRSVPRLSLLGVHIRPAGTGGDGGVAGFLRPPPTGGTRRISAGRARRPVQPVAPLERGDAAGRARGWRGHPLVALPAPASRPAPPSRRDRGADRRT